MYQCLADSSHSSHARLTKSAQGLTSGRPVKSKAVKRWNYGLCKKVGGVVNIHLLTSPTSPAQRIKRGIVLGGGGTPVFDGDAAAVRSGQGAAIKVWLAGLQIGRATMLTGRGWAKG